MKDNEIPELGFSKIIAPTQCKKCIFRNKVSVEMDGEMVEVGWEKSMCEIFIGPGGRYKPMEIMKDKVDCPLRKDE